MANIFIDEFNRSDFTRTQEKIARYCVDHTYAVARMTLGEMAAKAGVSEVSILKFVRKLGYNGFVDFRNSVMDRLERSSDTIDTTLGASLSQRMHGNRSGRDGQPLLRKHIVTSMKCIENSLLQNNEAVLEASANALLQADHIFVAGLRSMYGLAERFTQSLDFLTDGAILAPNGYYEIIQKLNSAKEGDILFLLCFSRFFRSDETVLQVAKEHGMKIILLTNASVSPITTYADALLIADAKSEGFFNSGLGAMSILEYIILFMTEQVRDNINGRLDFNDTYLNPYRY